MRFLLFILLLETLVTGAPLLGAIIFQASADTQQLSPTIDSVRLAGVEHVFLCQPAHSTREMEGYMSEWSKHSRIPSTVHKGTRNACLAIYPTSVPPSIVTVVLVEWNMRLHVNGSIPISHWYLNDEAEDTGAEYAVVPDQNGLVLDWTPFVMRVGARCGYLGRFLCVDSDVAHRHMLQVEYELDVDKDTRELIERDMISPRKYPPPILSNVFITRESGKKKPQWSTPEPPADPGFAYAWYWMGRECESHMQPDMARNAYARRLDNSGDPGDLWYTVYRLGDMSVDPSQSIRLLLEAYDLQPRRREPLAALMRRYADEGKYTLCQLFGGLAMAIPFPRGPETGPHVEIPIYEWMVADELSVCMARLGHVKEAASLLDQLLANPRMTTMAPEHRTRMEENLLVWKTTTTPREKKAA